jgi:curved DNA-binding protein CbpA
MKTLYDLIGARREDDAENLKKAYRKAAKANHPDHHAGDPEAVRRFVRISAAYNILRDTEQRAAYDRTLENAREPRHAASKRAASPRSFVANTIAGAAATLMLGAAFMLFAHLSGMSLEDGGGHTVPQPAHTAAASPVRPAAAPQMPVMVFGPVVTLSANDGAAAEKIEHRAASEETKDRTAPSQETKDRAAPPQGAKEQAAPSQEATGKPAAAETTDRAASPERKADTAPDSAGPTVDIAKHDHDVAGRVSPLSAADKHNGVPTSWRSHVAASGTRRDTRPDIKTDTRVRDPASTNGEGRPQAAPRRPPADRPGVQQARLEGGNGSTCTGSQSCPGDVPPLFGVGF